MKFKGEKEMNYTNVTQELKIFCELPSNFDKIFVFYSLATKSYFVNESINCIIIILITIKSLIYFDLIKSWIPFN